MTVGYSLNIERLYGSGIVRVAAKHLLRELAAELGADSHIDAARIGDNFILRGPDTAAGVAALAKSLMEGAGVLKCRKGAVTALELLFTLPAAAGIDPRRYFEQAVTWAERHFGVPVLSCVAHMDEGAPHAHALLLPLIDGHMVGSDLHGGKAKLAAMQTSFHEAVGEPNGLCKYVPQKRLSAPVRAAAMALARAKLQANAALTDGIIDALLVPHAKDPAPLLLALGIAMPESAGKREASFAARMTKPCKPEPKSPIGKGNRKPIGKAIAVALPFSLPDTCVGKGNRPSPNPAHEQPQQPATASTSDQQASRTDFVRLVEQREPGAAHQQAAKGMQKVLDNLPAPAGGASALLHPKERNAPSRQPPSSATLLPCPSVQTVSLAQAGTGKIPDTPAGAHKQPNAGAPNADEILARKDASIRGVIPAGAPKFGPTPAGADARKPAHISLLNAKGEQSCQPGHVPAQPGILENTETGAASQPTTTPASGGSLRSAWPSQPPMVGGDFQRQRDGDHLAASWCSDRGEFVPATGPPRGAQQQHQQPARRYRVHQTRKATS